MTSWTAEQVAQRFEECVMVLRRLPIATRLGHASYWPEIVLKPSEIARHESRAVRLSILPEQISRMEETLLWITWVNHGHRNLIWLRAHRTPWRVIARETGFPKTSVQRYWQGALQKIARQLNQDTS